MTWTVKYAKSFQKDVRKLDKQIQRKIKLFFDELENLDNPKSKGKSLTSNLSGLWRYRIADFRIICEIKDDELVILTLKVGHRSKIYEK